MKLITAVVRPDKLDEVMRAATAAGARGLTAIEVRAAARRSNLHRQWERDSHHRWDGRRWQQRPLSDRHDRHKYLRDSHPALHDPCLATPQAMMTALATCHSKGGQGTGRVQIILSLAILPACAIGSGFILEQDRPSIGTAEWP